jgi:gliding motility-associated-like protein
MQIIQSTIGKIGIGVVVVGGISATVYFTTKNQEVIKETVIQAIVEPAQIVDDINVITLTKDEKEIPLPISKATKAIPENNENTLTTKEQISIVEPQENVNYALQKESMEKIPSSSLNQSQKQTEEHFNQPINPSLDKGQTIDAPKINDATFQSELSESQTEEIIQPRFNIPNIFSPNGDNKNDFFVIENPEDVTEGHLYVYSITGKVLYENKNYHNEWDGQQLPDGIYLYIFINSFIKKENLFVKVL